MEDYNHLIKCTSWVKPTPERGVPAEFGKNCTLTKKYITN